MAEFLYHAWSGWTGYTDNGKLPVLLMAILLFLWFGRRQKEHRALLVYTSVMTVCCILPVTASVLMLYQTKFYNYEWIWSLVPMTAVSALGIAVMGTEYRAANGGQWKKVLPVTLFGLAILLFCGSLGRPVWDREAQREERLRAYLIVERLSDRYSGRSLCLWAPREIMEYAREKEAGITLPYGRNIWDGFLNAYAYDTYDEAVIMLEQWMANLERTGEADMETALTENADEAGGAESEAAGSGQAEGASNPSGDVVTLEKCVENALAQGVNCIMIGEEVSDETLARMEKALGTEAEVLEGYYLFVVP